MKATLLQTALLCLLATGARAQSQCVEPVAPEPVDGSRIGAEQLRAAMTEVREFMAQSDLYQFCLSREVEAGKYDVLPLDEGTHAAQDVVVAHAGQRTPARGSHGHAPGAL